MPSSACPPSVRTEADMQKIPWSGLQLALEQEQRGEGLPAGDGRGSRRTGDQHSALGAATRYGQAAVSQLPAASRPGGPARRGRAAQGLRAGLISGAMKDRPRLLQSIQIMWPRASPQETHTLTTTMVAMMTKRRSSNRACCMMFPVYNKKPPAALTWINPGDVSERKRGTGAAVAPAAPYPSISTIRRTGRLLTPSMPVSNSALAASPP
jgi:hypothetical protein